MTRLEEHDAALKAEEKFQIKIKKMNLSDLKKMAVRMYEDKNISLDDKFLVKSRQCCFVSLELNDRGVKQVDTIRFESY